jgi:hypothetical protein
MGEMTKAYDILIEKYERPLGEPTHKSEEGIKWILKKY